MGVCTGIHKYSQEVRFIVENNKLFILGARAGKRSPQSCLQIAVDLVREGTLTEREALLHFNPINFSHLKGSDNKSRLPNLLGLPPGSNEGELIGWGMVSCTGIATGYIAFTSEQVMHNASLGRPSIWCFKDTGLQEDVEILKLAIGVLVEVCQLR